MSTKTACPGKIWFPIYGAKNPKLAGQLRSVYIAVTSSIPIPYGSLAVISNITKPYGKSC